ncbi:guanine deaminase [Lichenihabitans sp. Uapishka_5]|uniref:guanine deaminase n=1 Tax=Lichenihabitans sp. Uapishka_5 TaxID=3037302 RepID=UPI0029E7DA70|nr:guanine deaminase [Lichenihabitans sp. Uapishka_5]MDX7950387.1 guanine deaminase [Lichenihabitans sp. Uapishka_5]
MPATIAIRGGLVTFRDDPFRHPSRDCLLHELDALILIVDGRIAQVGPYATLRHAVPDGVPVTHYENAVISAGFVDCHVHYPQLPLIAAYGAQLLEWLEHYVFPVEARYADPVFAAEVAATFLRELLRNGTTTAAVYCTVHPQSVEAFFTEAARFDARMVAGKVLMDRHAPDDLRDTAQQGYDESAALMDRWHGRGRAHYCVTPRFAPTSTDAQLEAAGALLKRADGLYMQTHIAENRAECAWVETLFPERASYLDVYAHAGLIGSRSVLGHGIHLGEADLCACHAAGAALAHCPTSNLFLGSGLFRLFDALDPRRPVRVGLGTDVGAGTSLGQLATLNEAYKVAQMTGHTLSAAQAFWLATAGGAEALSLGDRIGRVAPGFEADLCVLDLGATPLMRFRMPFCDTLDDQLFALMTLGDDRAVRATYVAGRKVYDRDADDFFPLPDRPEARR